MVFGILRGLCARIEIDVFRTDLQQWSKSGVPTGTTWCSSREFKITFTFKTKVLKIVLYEVPTETTCRSCRQANLNTTLVKNLFKYWVPVRYMVRTLL